MTIRKNVLVLLCAAGLMVGFVSHVGADLDPAALELLNAVSVKLGSAQTIRVAAEHELDDALGLGTRIDSGPIQVIVQRPNKFYAMQSAGMDTREIAFDGSFLCVMHPEMKHYALEPLEAGSIEQFADLVNENFGFRPPVIELLANDMASELLIDVTLVGMTEHEDVRGTDCQRLHFEQPGMTIDLWVESEDQLPRRMLITLTDLSEPAEWNILFSHWELDAPVDEQLFSKRPDDGSQKVKMLKTD